MLPVSAVEKEVMKRRGLTKQHSAIEHEVWQWKISLEKKRGGQRVTKTEIQTFALEAYKTAGITSFKASDGWYRRWRVRWQQSESNNSKDISEEVTTKNLNSTADESFEENVSVEPSKKRKKDKIQTGSSRNTKKRTTIDSNSDKITHENYADNSIKSRDLSNKLESPGESFCSNIENNKTDTMLTGQNLENDKSPIPGDLMITCDDVIEIDSTKINNTAIIHKKIENFVKDHKIKTDGIWDGSKSNDTTILSVDSLLTENCDSNKRVNLLDSSLIKTGFQEGTASKTQLESNVPLSASCATMTFSLASPLFDQGVLHFEDHELYCDSCEDFHPRHQKIPCKKQDKNLVNSSLLSCVFEKRRSLSESSSSGKPSEGTGNKLESKSDSKDDLSHLTNPTVVQPKGRRYLFHFKNQVVSYAIKNSIQLAAERFKVNRNSVSEWLAERRRISGEGSTKFIDKVASDSSVLEFFNWLEGTKYYLTNEVLQQKASEWLRSQEGVGKPCHWLYMYANRICNSEDKIMKKRYIAYPAAFKKVVVFYAQTHSNLAASRVFGVARRRIIEWQHISKASKLKGEDCKVTSSVTDSIVDEKVFEWYKGRVHPPSSKEVRVKALELYREAGYSDIRCGPNWYYRWRARHNLPTARAQLYSDLSLLTWILTQIDNNKNVTHSSLITQAMDLNHSKVSRGWTYRFCRKHHLLLSTLPVPSCPPLPSLEQRVSEYQLALQSAITDRGLTDVNIIAMDEVPLQFLQKESSNKPQLLWQPGFKTCQATLMVSCLANGVLLPSVFIFKEPGPTCQPDPSVLSVVSAVGLVTEDVMNQWLQNICFKHLPKNGGVLVTDCYDVHTLASVNQACSEHSVNNAVIPAGCGFWVLPVISLCQKFKVLMEKKCSEWLSSQSATGGLKPPSPDQLYAWALRIHKQLAKNETETLKTEFKTRLLPSIPSHELL